MAFFQIFKKKRAIKKDSEILQVIDRLTEFGYFKYTDEANLEAVKKEVGTFLVEKQLLTSPDFSKPLFCLKDYRHYQFDGEALFEADGFTDMFRKMNPLFTKMNFEFVVTNHVEEWDDERKWLNHSMTINGKNYVAFRNFRGYGWGEAAQRFAEMVNDQFVLQNKNEQLYLCNAGNDGFAVFLPPALYEYIFPKLADPIGGFMPVAQWCSIMGVDPLKYLGE